MAHKTYSPKDVKIAISGVDITGFAEDDFLTLSRTSPLMEPTVGADGILGRTKVADRTGTITLSIAQTAKVNFELAALASFSNTALTGDIGLLHFEIKDPSGSVLAIGLNAVLQEYPEVGLGSVGNKAKEWTFHCEVLEFNQVPDELVSLLPSFIVDAGAIKKG